jgi:hypothetical protein
MAELTPDDVAQYTSGRLAADGAETQRLLSAGLTHAQRHCGWHVVGIRDVQGLLRNGTGGKLLALPTLRLLDLTSLTENGVALDVTGIVESADAAGHLYKKSGGTWSRGYSNIVVAFTHGFDDADDFNAAVLSFVDRSSLTVTGGRANAVGPFKYDVEAMSAGSAFSAVERALLEQYRLESAP